MYDRPYARYSTCILPCQVSVSAAEGVVQAYSAIVRQAGPGVLDASES